MHILLHEYLPYSEQKGYETVESNICQCSKQMLLYAMLYVVSHDVQYLVMEIYSTFTTSVSFLRFILLTCDIAIVSAHNNADIIILIVVIRSQAHIELKTNYAFSHVSISYPQT